MTESKLLQGSLVVAVEQAVAAPLCTRHLAELGADVIKVERVGVGDFTRHYDSSVKGYSAHFVWLNHGKRSVALNLKTTEGREILQELLISADVLVSNLGPGAIDRIISKSVLKELNPRLIHCVISGYGSEGPFSKRKAYDSLVQGEAGVTLNTGTPNNPAKPGVSLADLAAGVYAFGAINAALLGRQRDGVGRRLEISLFDSATEWMMPLLLAQRYTGETPPPSGTRHASIAPYGPYISRDGRSVNIAVQNDHQWSALCSKVLNKPSLISDPRFDTNESRYVNRVELDLLICEEFKRHRANKLETLLDESDVPWGHLNNTSDVLEHPQLASRQRWTEAELPNGEPYSVLLPTFLNSAHSDIQRVPRLGEHTAQVLTQLGYTDEQVVAFERNGAIELAD